MKTVFFPAEWFPQSGVQLAWPHEETDWSPMLDEVIPVFVQLAWEIMQREHLLVVCRRQEAVLDVLTNATGHSLRASTDRSLLKTRLHLFELPSNDTWARDHGPISVYVDGQPFLYDFTFNGWGQKFASEKDNNLTRLLFQKGAFDPSVRLQSFPFVLEGGSIEGNGEGVLLTTTRCLTEVHRNPGMNREGIDEWLKSCLGLKQILWLEEGYLAGDDTDGHIDMLARFCNPDTIAYVAPPEAEDEHAPALRRMEAAIKSWRTPSGAPYQLIPLPLPDPVYEGGERLPASYANFLIINGAVLVPTYRGSKDQLALELLQQAFPDRTVIGIDCLPLIRQHGSLHCLTMQYPVGFLRDDGIQSDRGMSR